MDRYWEPLTIDPVQYLGRNEERKEEFYYNPELAIDRFSLYGIEFGNWMNQEDRLNALYASLVTFTDMAKVLRLPYDRIGLKGKLALALGARGNGGRAAAHYEPFHTVINLTKEGGKGSLVHEWGHAFDHFINYDSCKGKGLASRSIQPTCENSALLLEIIDRVLYDDNGTPTTYKIWLKSQSKYYNSKPEIWARICERYFHTKFRDAGISNAWGVDRHPGDDWPDKRLVDNVTPLITKLFRKVLT